jgi:hypothetical protein
MGYGVCAASVDRMLCYIVAYGGFKKNISRYTRNRMQNPTINCIRPTLIPTLYGRPSNVTGTLIATFAHADCRRPSEQRTDHWTLKITWLLLTLPCGTLQTQLFYFDRKIASKLLQRNWPLKTLIRHVLISNSWNWSRLLTWALASKGVFTLKLPWIEYQARMSNSDVFQFLESEWRYQTFA